MLTIQRRLLCKPDAKDNPELTEIEKGHFVACYFEEITNLNQFF